MNDQGIRPSCARFSRGVIAVLALFLAQAAQAGNWPGWRGPRGEPTGGFLDYTTPEHGAATQVWAAVSTELADKGALYLEDCGVSEAVAPYARDERRAAYWWDLSEKLCDRS